MPIAAFRSAYSLDATLRIFSASGSLASNGESITLLRPEEPYIDSTVSMTTIVPFKTIDKVNYHGSAPWPTGPDGNSLQRIRSDEFGNDPANWRVAEATAGR